jgi:hypothetical protein
MNAADVSEIPRFCILLKEAGMTKYKATDPRGSIWVSTYKNGLKSSVVTTQISMNYGLYCDLFVMAQSMLQKKERDMMHK